MVGLVLAGCMTLTVPQGGEGTVRVVVGGFVETIEFVDGPTFNIQINDEDVPEGEALFPHELTIGKFSKVIGSGFTKRSNIYYRERIDYYSGNDTFSADGGEYRVSWKRNEWDVFAHTNIYYVTVEQVQPADEDPADK
jgi:hypothetical protein